MGNLTQAEVHGYLEGALAKIQPLKGDRLLWGNREASWTATERNYRFDVTQVEDAGWYRNRPGGSMRMREFITIHLVHRMAQDPQRTKAQAGSDAELVRRRLWTDSAIRAQGIRVYLDQGPITLSDSGDHLETDVPIRVEYDVALTEEVG